MKSTDEISRRVFARRDEYKKNRKRSITIATVASLAVIAAGAVIAIWAMGGVGYGEPLAGKTSGEKSVLSANTSPAATQHAAETEAPETEDVIEVNEVDGMQSWADFAGEETDRATVEAAFGFNVIPTPPADLSRAYYTELRSSGEDYDNYWYSSTFASETDHRWMITIVSNRDPQQDEALRIYVGDGTRVSTVCGVQVRMIHYMTWYGVEPDDELTPRDNYVCVFEYRSQYFRMEGVGLTLDEFTDAIRSIVAG